MPSDLKTVTLEDKDGKRTEVSLDQVQDVKVKEELTILANAVGIRINGKVIKKSS